MERLSSQLIRKRAPVVPRRTTAPARPAAAITRTQLSRLAKILLGTPIGPAAPKTEEKERKPRAPMGPSSPGTRGAGE